VRDKPNAAAVVPAGIFWHCVADGVVVAVKVQPRARREGVQGTVPDSGGTRLALAVREPAEDGRANRAACAALALALGVPARSVAVDAGATARRKMLHISGDPATLSARLAAL